MEGFGGRGGRGRGGREKGEGVLVFGGGGGAAEGGEPEVGDAGVGGGEGFVGEEALGGGGGLFDDEGVVEEVEGLGGDGAAGALADGAVDVGEVEGFEEVEAFVAEGGGVEGAAGVGEDVVVFEVLRGAAVGVDGGGLDVGAEEGLIEGAGEGEDGVAEGVGVEAAAVGAPEEFVFGVFGVGGLPVGVVGGEGGELVGAGEDEAADEFFEGPAVGDEVVGEVVEEEGVGGGIASGAEVVDGADEAFTEEVHPDAVDEDAGGEGVLRVGDPLGELEATALGGWDDRGVGDFGGLDEAAGDGGAEVADVAADVDGAVGG